ncbi:alpha-1-acid glycoprotein 2-like [Carlito syrichta]|uniref:Alpha-1-acid glycoprotein n=1 Tax=Carlito syrichta TaxID=1868482 RepID=A0A1U7T5S9_CARSF|nr:alpha-1-acid glycoprotein 2-like [Carlito syrichta]
MALPWVLAALSLLPLLDAQRPVCANLTVGPITNATLERISHKWFYIGSSYQDAEYKEEAKKIQVAFFYFTANQTEDTVLLREYMTVGDKCVYNVSLLNVQRENGTLSRYEAGREHVAHLLFLKDPRTFLLASYLDDEQKRGLSFYADQPEATQEQLGEFHKALECLGIPKSEAVYTDWKKDQCEPLESQHDKERKNENEGS